MAVSYSAVELTLFLAVELLCLDLFGDINIVT